MHMLHMHISMDIIITALSFFITDFLLSSVLVGVPALIGWHGNAFASICQPLFLYSVYLPKKRGSSPAIFVQFRPNRGEAPENQPLKNRLKNHTAMTKQTASDAAGAYQMALPPMVKANTSRADA